ncbi:MAG TPA: CAP domain-containing protein [Chloroflexia bacterium]|nr:CAP domain-containing protein [Chloroflexia bacterium]
MRVFKVIALLALLGLVTQACGSENNTPTLSASAGNPATAVSSPAPTSTLAATPTAISLNATPSISANATSSPGVELSPAASPTVSAAPTTVLSPTSAASATPLQSPTPTVVIAPTPTAATGIAPATVAGLVGTPAGATTSTSADVAVVTVAPGSPDSEEQLFLKLLNDYRQANGKPPLTFDPHLYQSAHWMAQDMAQHNVINHTDSLGRDIPTRIKSFGYSGRWVGENIAGGFEHAADNMSVWESDDIHRNNLLGASYTHAAAARYYTKVGYNHWVWVLDMG